MTAPWRWVDLGGVDGATMVNVFVAVAAAVGAGRSPPTVVVLYPSAPFANVGFHQEAEREIDLDYCRTEGIPVVRRVVGGGAILDGPWEHDYMIVVPSGAPATDGSVTDFYEHYLAPVRATLARLGVRAERSGVNDLAAGGRKVSANGAMQLTGSWVLVGDVLLDLDVDAMSRVLLVPDEKFRGKLAGSMRDWLTSVSAQTGRRPERAEVSATLREECAKAFGATFLDGALSTEESETLSELKASRGSEAWTFRRDRDHPDLARAPPPGRAVKVSAEATLARVDRKGGKLLRVTLLHRRRRIEQVELSGDFFTQPFDPNLADLERSLGGLTIEPATLGRAVTEWLDTRGVRLLGVTPEDIAGAIVEAAQIPIASS